MTLMSDRFGRSFFTPTAAAHHLASLLSVVCRGLSTYNNYHKLIARVYLPTYWLREQLIAVVEQIGSSQEIWTRGPRWTQGIKSELLHPTRYTRICLALHGPWDRARARKSQDSRSSLDTSRRVCVHPVAFDRLFNLTNDSAWTGRSPALGVKPIASFITATELVELCMLWLDKSCILFWIHCVKVVTGGLERFEWVTVLKMESNARFSVVEPYSIVLL